MSRKHSPVIWKNLVTQFFVKNELGSKLDLLGFSTSVHLFKM